MNIRAATGPLCLLILASAPSMAGAQGGVTPEEARAIAKEAYIYGNPMVDNYRIQYDFFVDRQGSQYKTTWNQLLSMARVSTPADTAVQSPNSDTPYSFIGMDLRTEPLVLTVPPIEKGRYFSLQFIDWYTHNFAYVGSRATGNDGGAFLVAGPNWTGEAPATITKVLRSETELVFVLYRTQLYNPADIDEVKKIQAGYRVQPLSEFMGRPAPAPAPTIAWMKPLSVEDQKTSLEFFNLLNFVLQFCPTVSSERDLMARFAKIGVGSGKRIDVDSLSSDIREALAAGIADAWKSMHTLEATDIAAGRVTSGDLFGTREFLKNNYLYRFTGAVLGIYGNTKTEAMYPIYRVDSHGDPLDASKHRYALRFAPGQLPAVNAFWSVTMYRLPESLLVENPIDRYLINSPMLDSLQRDPDGGVTIYIQNASPGKDKESNWLPAPAGQFWIAMRLYWPKTEALDGTWKQPALAKVQ